MSEVIISVRGEHERRMAPERGTVHLTVQTEGPDRGTVVERVAALAEPVREQLREREGAGSVAQWSSARAAVWSERPWNTEGKQLAPVHHASVEFKATFTDFAALSWWVGEVSMTDGVQIGQVSWSLSPETAKAVEAAVAAEAVHVAVARATAYAAAIGRHDVTPTAIADLGLLPRAESHRPEMLRAAMAMDAAGGPGIDLQPEEIVITAAVEARFSAR